ncbi:MAG: carboxypeptidase regulatory-like domain-containing protein [Acidobacteria bacterium]|nr:carboxypeptidase regulatory-like domain-containing protein [Acidobacteriota bacterium]
MRIALLALAGSVFLFGQDISGTIGGTILDQNSATVPNAKVTVTNTDRNQVVRTITTDATGTYAAPLIPVGTYAVKVEAAGFKTENRTGITLNVNDDLKINFTLQVGTVTETINVEESAVAVELGNPADATVIDGQQVRELSLGTRNYEQLVALMPGVAANPTDELYIGNSSPSGMAATLPYFVNGNRNSANNWTVDGADNVDRGSNLTLMTFPSVDAISQFKVERSLYTADTGRAGGAQISVVTKMGTSQFHGGVYEFFRNDALAANNWANNANKVNMVDPSNPMASCVNNPNCKAKIPPLRWNDFGGTIGGPIYIPGKFNKDRNKTFFFYSQEHRRVITYTTFNPTLPTQSMLTGAMVQPVCITTTTGCAAGSTPVTQIPANLINPVAAAYIKDIFGKLPLASANTVAATTSGFYAQRNLYNSDQYIGRIDHSFNESFTVWGKFEIDQIPTTEPGGLFTGSAIPGGAITNTNSPGRSTSIHFVNTFKPTLLNEAGFNFSQSAIHAIPAGLTSKTNSPDINPVLPFPNTQGVIPTVTITGGSSIIGYGPYNEFNRNFTWFDNLTWIRGRHTWKFGWTTHRYNKTENAASGQGTFGFQSTGVPTGTTSFQQAFANFLLGNTATFTQPSTDITPDIWSWTHEAYAQDDWKVNPHLTVFAGVRWSFFGQPTDSGKLLDNFNPNSYSAANAPQISPTTGNKIAGTGNNPNMNGIIVGGVNSPYGDHVGNQVYKNFAPRVGIAWDPFGTGRTSIRAGYGVYYDSGLVGTYEQNTFANPPYVNSVTISNAPFNNITGGTLAAASLAPLGLHATQIPALIPYTQQFSFNIQRTLARDTTLEVGYFGTKGTHLLGIVDINQAYPGAAYAAGLHSNTTYQTIFTSTDTPRINAIRPYLGFNSINTLETAFDSNYHSLQVNFAKRFRGAGSVRAAYTYSKTLTDNGSDRSNAAQNSYNWHNGEYGPAPGDRTHVLTFNYVYQLPIFRGSRGIVGAALKGWQVSGIGSFYTGQPSTITTSAVDPAGLGLLGTSAASSRPDMICDPNANAPHGYAGSPSSTSAKWFNTACFVPVADGAIRPGNAGRGTVRGPGFANMDITLSKNFNLDREGKRQFQLRGETFNTFNLVNPSGFSSTNITSTTFGVISSYRAPRRVQIAAKISF